VSVPEGYLTIEGVSPVSRGPCTFLVARQKVDNLQRYGPSSKFYDLALLPEVLKTPDAIFRGLKREGLTDSYGYSRSPSRRWQSATIELPPPPGLVFVVFINRDHRGYVVLDWEMRKTHPSDRGHPLRWEDDFEGRLWPTP
jgi:hypothetical protein